MVAPRSKSQDAMQSGLSTEDAPSLAQKELAEKRRQNNIALIGILVTFLVAVISLVWNSRIQKQTSSTSEKLQQTQLDTGEVETLINTPGYPWKRWKQPFGLNTVALGISREVAFDQPFRKPPKVTVSIKTLDYPDLGSAIEELGYKSNDVMTAKNRHVTVYADARDVTEKGFRLCVGLSFRPNVEEFLETRLGDKALVDTHLLSDMQTAHMLEPHPNLTPDEIWMINFYKYFGSYSFSWIAQTKEDQSKAN